MKKLDRYQLGAWAEELVRRRAVKRGFDCLAQRFRLGRVEWDLLLWKNGTVWMVEVRSRRVRAAWMETNLLPWQKIARLQRSLVPWEYRVASALSPRPVTQLRWAFVAVHRSQRYVRLRFHEVIDGEAQSVNH